VGSLYTDAGAFAFVQGLPLLAVMAARATSLSTRTQAAAAHPALGRKGTSNCVWRRTRTTASPSLQATVGLLLVLLVLALV
jgi:hypothetical protein